LVISLLLEDCLVDAIDHLVIEIEEPSGFGVCGNRSQPKDLFGKSSGKSAMQPREILNPDRALRAAAFSLINITTVR
jgi:hypothetical protein